MTDILKTTNYDMFKFHPSNREINKANLKHVVNSIKACNMLEFRPIVVDSNMSVMDGQHRLLAAKELSLPIYYQVKHTSTHEDIVLLNIQKRWNSEDYFNYHASLGNVGYQKVIDFAKKHGASVGEVWSNIARGTSAAAKLAMKKGQFDIDSIVDFPALDELYILAKDIINHMKIYCPPQNKCLVSKKLRSAVLNLMAMPGFQIEVFKEKIKLRAETVRICGDLAGYVIMLRSIYNYKNREPLEFGPRDSSSVG